MEKPNYNRVNPIEYTCNINSHKVSGSIWSFCSQKRSFSSLFFLAQTTSQIGISTWFPSYFLVELIITSLILVFLTWQSWTPLGQRVLYFCQSLKSNHDLWIHLQRLQVPDVVILEEVLTYPLEIRILLHALYITKMGRMQFFQYWTALSCDEKSIAILKLL